MTDWQVTATTLHCPDVDDEVTIMVYKDWSVKCAAAEKYAKPSKDTTRRLKTRGKQLKRELRCNSADCQQAREYKAKLLAEEKRKESKLDF